jgi:hypothetical protein
MARRIQPDETWVDIFGDRLDINQAGEDVVLCIIRKSDSIDDDHACVSLGPLQQRQLRARLGRDEFAARIDAVRELIEPHLNRWGSSDVGDLARSIRQALDQRFT